MCPFYTAACSTKSTEIILFRLYIAAKIGKKALFSTRAWAKARSWRTPSRLASCQYKSTISSALQVNFKSGLFCFSKATA